jgi:dipeptidyl aminopeptidase/acylaminoacyl peptidase
VYAPNGRSLAIVSNRGNLEERRIWIVPVDGSAPRQLTRLPSGIETNPQWSPDSTKIYFLRSTPLEPPNLYVASTTGEPAPRALTQTPDLRQTGAQVPEVVHFKSRDGLEIAGMLHRPPGFTPGTRYPAVLWVHGGPETQDGFGFSPWALVLAQEGYVVLQPNYRGGVGYGERFRNLNVEDYGGGEVDDVIAGARFLVDQGLADPRRVAIGGASHGGTIVNYAVTKYPDVFAAGIDLYGVTDRATYIALTNRNSAIRAEIRMGGTPEQKPAVYRKANAIPDIPKVRTPLLIMHGEADPQVPLDQSVQLVNALRKEGKVFVFVTYPREGHGFAEREHRLDAWTRQLAFLRQYLQPA